MHIYHELSDYMELLVLLVSHFEIMDIILPVCLVSVIFQMAE